MKGETGRVPKALDTFLKYLGILMALTYIAAGLAVLLNGSTTLSIPRPFIMPVGTALLAYGLYRSYRLYLKYFKGS
jgi:hypothetical protein